MPIGAIDGTQHKMQLACSHYGCYTKYITSDHSLNPNPLKGACSMSITSENIQFYRKQHSLTQNQLASLTNLSRSTIASYESGRTEPDIASLQTFSNIFNVSLDDLLCTSQAVLLARNAAAKKFCYCFIAIINIIMLFRNVAISLLSMNRFYLPIDTPLNDAQSNTLHLINMISNGIVFEECVTI